MNDRSCHSAEDRLNHVEKLRSRWQRSSWTPRFTGFGAAVGVSWAAAWLDACV
jgi:hypothetical protein